MTEPDRLEAMQGAAAESAAELAALDALIHRLRAADPARGAEIDPAASWARIEAFLDGNVHTDGDTEPE